MSPTVRLREDVEILSLSINVGVSHKAARSYQSTDVPINLSAELDPSFLDRPE